MSGFDCMSWTSSSMSDWNGDKIVVSPAASSSGPPASASTAAPSPTSDSFFAAASSAASPTRQSDENRSSGNNNSHVVVADTEKKNDDEAANQTEQTAAAAAAALFLGEEPADCLPKLRKMLEEMFNVALIDYHVRPGGHCQLLDDLPQLIALRVAEVVHVLKRYYENNFDEKTRRHRPYGFISPHTIVVGADGKATLLPRHDAAARFRCVSFDSKNTSNEPSQQQQQQQQQQQMEQKTTDQPAMEPPCELAVHDFICLAVTAIQLLAPVLDSEEAKWRAAEAAAANGPTMRMMMGSCAAPFLSFSSPPSLRLDTFQESPASISPRQWLKSQLTRPGLNAENGFVVEDLTVEKDMTPRAIRDGELFRACCLANHDKFLEKDALGHCKLPLLLRSLFDTYLLPLLPPDHPHVVKAAERTAIRTFVRNALIGEEENAVTSCDDILRHVPPPIVSCRHQRSSSASTSSSMGSSSGQISPAITAAAAAAASHSAVTGYVLPAVSPTSALPPVPCLSFPLVHAATNNAFPSQFDDSRGGTPNEANSVNNCVYQKLAQQREWRDSIIMAGLGCFHDHSVASNPSSINTFAKAAVAAMHQQSRKEQRQQSQQQQRHFDPEGHIVASVAEIDDDIAHMDDRLGQSIDVSTATLRAPIVMPMHRLHESVLQETADTVDRQQQQSESLAEGFIDDQMLVDTLAAASDDDGGASDNNSDDDFIMSRSDSVNSDELRPAENDINSTTLQHQQPLLGLRSTPAIKATTAAALLSLPFIRAASSRFRDPIRIGSFPSWSCFVQLMHTRPPRCDDSYSGVAHSKLFRMMPVKWQAHPELQLHPCLCAKIFSFPPVEAGDATSITDQITLEMEHNMRVSKKNFHLDEITFDARITEEQRQRRLTAKNHLVRWHCGIVSQIDNEDRAVQLFDYIRATNLDELQFPKTSCSTGNGSNRRLSTELIRQTAAELLIALDYLHNVADLLHLDLRNDNVLLDRASCSLLGASKQHIRLCDIGSARALTPRPPAPSRSKQRGRSSLGMACLAMSGDDSSRCSTPGLGASAPSSCPAANLDAIVAGLVAEAAIAAAASSSSSEKQPSALPTASSSSSSSSAVAAAITTTRHLCREEARLRIPCRPEYSAPELVAAARSDDAAARERLTPAADVWSLGMVLLQMAVGERPLERTTTEYYTKLYATHQDGQTMWAPLYSPFRPQGNDKEPLPYDYLHPVLRNGSDADMLNFILSCLQVDTAKRATVEQLLHSDFVKPYFAAKKG